MDLSDADREQLEQLQKLRDSGDITNEEYQRLSWSIIKDKGEKPALGGSAVDPSKPLKSSGKVAPSGQQDPLSSSPMSFSSSRRASFKPGPGGGLDSRISVSSMAKRRGWTQIFMLSPLGMSFLLKALIVLVLSAGVSLGALRYFNDKGGGSSGQGGTPPKVGPNRLYHSFFIQPLFGELAKKSCKWRCGIRSGDMKAACNRGCGSLKLRNYGRRITLEAFDPQQDAAEIVSRCMKKEIEPTLFYTKSDWTRQMRRTLREITELPQNPLTGNYSQASQLFSFILKTNNELRFPPAEDATKAENNLSEGLIRATCLRANLILTEMAIDLVQRHSDKFSTRFYTKLHQELRPKTIDAENRLLQQPKAKELLNHGS